MITFRSTADALKNVDPRKSNCSSRLSESDTGMHSPGAESNVESQSSTPFDEGDYIPTDKIVR